MSLTSAIGLVAVEVAGDFLDVGDLALDLLEVAHLELVFQHVELGQEIADLFLFVAGQSLQAGMKFVADEGLLQLFGGGGDLALVGLVPEDLDGLADPVVDLQRGGHLVRDAQRLVVPAPIARACRRPSRRRVG